MRDDVPHGIVKSTDETTDIVNKLDQQFVKCVDDIAEIVRTLDDRRGARANALEVRPGWPRRYCAAAPRRRAGRRAATLVAVRPAPPPRRSPCRAGRRAVRARAVPVADAAT
jgi:hypothetical protein